jgi:uncharacterized protein (TIGR01244 family)
MRSISALSILLITVALLVGASAAGVIPNLNSPRVYIYTAGQPDEEGFQQLSNMGIKTIINVLPERNCLPDEPGMVAANHMVYRSVPFNLNKFRKETIEQFAEILEDSEKPVLIHCSTGNHAGAMWFAYRVLQEEAPLQQALLEARAIGMKPQVEEPLVDWVMSERLK